MQISCSGFGGQYLNLFIDGALQPGKGKKIEDCSRSRNSLYIPDILKNIMFVIMLLALEVLYFHFLQDGIGLFVIADS